MADTSSRMLQLLGLLQTNQDWSGPALADELGVSDRTIRSDIDTLRELGYPVDVTRGAGGHYRLGAGNQLPPLVFDNDQAVAVALQVAPRTIDGLSDAASRALDTVLQVMPSRLRHLVGHIEITSTGTPGTSPRRTCTKTSCWPCPRPCGTARPWVTTTPAAATNPARRLSSSPTTW